MTAKIEAEVGLVPRDARIAHGHRKRGEAGRGLPSLSEGTWTARQLYLRPADSRTVTEQICVVFSNPVCVTSTAALENEYNM